MTAKSKFSKRHYSEIAKIFNKFDTVPAHEQAALAFANVVTAFIELFEKDSSSFNREKFLKACGLEKP